MKPGPGLKRPVSTCLWALSHRVDLGRYSDLASLGLSFLIWEVEAMTVSTSLGRNGNHKSQRMEGRRVTCKARAVGSS